MKWFGVLLLCFSSLFASTQKKVSLSAAGDFSFDLHGLGLNDGGIGFHVQANFFSKQRLQLHAETGLDHFFGDKLLELNPNGGTYNRNPTITRLIAGPELFIVKQLSLTGLGGVAWSNWLNQSRPQSFFRVVLDGHLGRSERWLIGFSLSLLPNDDRFVQYSGIHLGHKIF